LKSLSDKHQDLLTDYEEHLKSIEKCLEENQYILSLMIEDEEHLFENQRDFYPNGEDEVLKKCNSDCQ